MVVICGPPGAGKSTLAATLGLKVYDFDEWRGSPAAFRAEIARLRGDPNAQAAVIRCDPHAGTAEMCAATEQIVLDVPLAECIRRIRARRRTQPPIRVQIAVAQQWWRNFEREGRPHRRRRL